MEDARRAEGVVAVFTAADLNDKVAVSMLPTLFQGADDFMAPLVPLAADDVRFVGDPVALIVAETRYLAEDAAELVEVDYEPLQAIVDYESAAAAELVHPNRPSNVAMMMGEAASDEMFEGAAHVVRGTVRQHRYSMVPDGVPRRRVDVRPVRRAPRRALLEPEPARGAPRVQSRHRRPDPQRPRADRRRRWRVRPQVVRRS